jgi:hypothetical protein
VEASSEQRTNEPDCLLAVTCKEMPTSRLLLPSSVLLMKTNGGGMRNSLSISSIWCSGKREIIWFDWNVVRVSKDIKNTHPPPSSSSSIFSYGWCVLFLPLVTSFFLRSPVLHCTRKATIVRLSLLSYCYTRIVFVGCVSWLTVQGRGLNLGHTVSC